MSYLDPDFGPLDSYTTVRPSATTTTTIVEQRQPKTFEISTANAATIAFVIIALALAAIALAFGVIAWNNTNTLYAYRNTIINTLRIDAITNNVVVQTNIDANQTVSLIFNVRASTSQTGNLITGVYLRKIDGTLIADYPYVAQNGQVKVTIPTNLALSSGVIIPNLLNSNNRTSSGYSFDGTNWTIIVTYRVPPSNATV